LRFSYNRHHITGLNAAAPQGLGKYVDPLMLDSLDQHIVS